MENRLHAFKHCQLWALFLMILLLSGCNIFRGFGVAVIPKQVITDPSIAAISEKYQDAVCTETDNAGCTVVGKPRAGSWLAHIETCQQPSRDDNNCRIIRDAMISELILIADHNYLAYEGNVIAGRAKKNFYVGGLRTSLETAGALITVADTTRVLSGLAAFTGTINETADKEFYFDSTVAALIIQMRADRTEALLPLLNGRNVPYPNYSIETAVGDITAYYRAGTLASAIVSISKSASAAEADAEVKLNDAKNLGHVGAARRAGAVRKKPVAAGNN